MMVNIVVDNNVTDNLHFRITISLVITVGESIKINMWFHAAFTQKWYLFKRGVNFKTAISFCNSFAMSYVSVNTNSVVQCGEIREYIRKS